MPGTPEGGHGGGGGGNGGGAGAGREKTENAPGTTEGTRQEEFEMVVAAVAARQKLEKELGLQPAKGLSGGGCRASQGLRAASEVMHPPPRSRKQGAPACKTTPPAGWTGSAAVRATLCGLVASQRGVDVCGSLPVGDLVDPSPAKYPPVAAPHGVPQQGLPVRRRLRRIGHTGVCPLAGGSLAEEPVPDGDGGRAL